MPHVYENAAVEILDWYHRAERDLLDHPIVTFNGEAGTVRAVKLDPLHGLCFTVDDPHLGYERFYPVSTIRYHGSKA
jgi:hypothetical protein